jgi:hypothetical protein
MCIMYTNILNIIYNNILNIKKTEKIGKLIKIDFLFTKYKLCPYEYMIKDINYPFAILVICIVYHTIPKN